MLPKVVRLNDAERGYAIAQQYRAEVVAQRWLEVLQK